MRWGIFKYPKKDKILLGVNSVTFEIFIIAHW